MNKIAVRIIQEEDYDLVMSVLKAFEEKRIISLDVESDDLVMPGSPVSVERLNREIEMAEKSKIYSYEDFKAKYQL